MTTTRAAALPVRRSARPPLRAVDHLPAEDFLGRAGQVGVEITGPLSAGGLRVDLTGYSATLDGMELDLSPRQVELLAVFLASPRRVWSRDQLHWLCWGDASPSRRVDVQLCRLRARTGLELFRNVRDRGWALRPLP